MQTINFPTTDIGNIPEKTTLTNTDALLIFDQDNNQTCLVNSSLIKDLIQTNDYVYSFDTSNTIYLTSVYKERDTVPLEMISFIVKDDITATNIFIKIDDLQIIQLAELSELKKNQILFIQYNPDKFVFETVNIDYLRGSDGQNGVDSWNHTTSINNNIITITTTGNNQNIPDVFFINIPTNIVDPLLQIDNRTPTSLKYITDTNVHHLTAGDHKIVLKNQQYYVILDVDAYDVSVINNHIYISSKFNNSISNDTFSSIEINFVSPVDIYSPVLFIENITSQFNVLNKDFMPASIYQGEYVELYYNNGYFIKKNNDVIKLVNPTSIDQRYNNFKKIIISTNVPFSVSNFVGAIDITVDSIFSVQDVINVYKSNVAINSVIDLPDIVIRYSAVTITTESFHSLNIENSDTNIISNNQTSNQIDVIFNTNDTNFYKLNIECMHKPVSSICNLFFQDILANSEIYLKNMNISSIGILDNSDVNIISLKKGKIAFDSCYFPMTSTTYLTLPLRAYSAKVDSYFYNEYTNNPYYIDDFVDNDYDIMFLNCDNSIDFDTNTLGVNTDAMTSIENLVDLNVRVLVKNTSATSIYDIKENFVTCSNIKDSSSYNINYKIVTKIYQ